MTPSRQRFTILTVLILVATCLPALAGEKSEKILRVEGDVEKPVRIHGPAPTYPALAKEERIQGQVVAKAVITKEGDVEDVEIVESLGEDFDQTVLDTLAQWKFEPAKLDGEPVAVFYTLTFNFRLEGGKSEDQDQAPS